MKSRMVTTDDTSIHTVWPVLYSISEKKIKIVQMKESQIQRSETALIIDQGDFCHLYITDENIRSKIIKETMQTTSIQTAINNILRS